MAYKRNLGFPLAPTFEDEKKKNKKKKTTRTVKGMKVDNKQGSDNITKRGTLTSKRGGVGTASTSTKSNDSTSGLKKTKTEKAPKVKKTKVEKISDRAKRRGRNPDYYVNKYNKKQEAKARKKAIKAGQKADWDAKTPEEKKQAAKNTRQQRTGKVANAVKGALRKVGIGKKSAQTGKKNKKVKSCASGGKVYNKRSCKAKNTKNIN